MADDPNLETLGSIYSSIMANVADRLDAVAESIEAVNANPLHANSWRHAEFAYLQVRKSIEYIALALLAAHKTNGYECEKLENAYKADVIFSDLKKLNEHGFPKAIQINTNGINKHHVEPQPFLTRKRMKRIYDNCAVHLHSGRLSNIINQTIPPYDLPKVAAWHSELLSMLSNHMVMLPHAKIVMIAWLREPETGQAKVVFAKADSAFQIEGDGNICGADKTQ